MNGAAVVLLAILGLVEICLRVAVAVLTAFFALMVMGERLFTENFCFSLANRLVSK